MTTSRSHPSRRWLLLLAIVVLLAGGALCLVIGDPPLVGGSADDPGQQAGAVSPHSQLASSNVIRSALPIQKTVIRVVDAAGAALTDARVVLDGDDGVIGSTDPAGCCVLEFDGGRVLRVSKRNYREISRPVVSGEKYEIVLAWDLEVAVDVVDDQGKAFPNVNVWLASRWQSLADLRESATPSGVTDASGHVAIRGLAPVTCYVHAYHPTHLVDPLRTPIRALKPPEASRTRVVMTPLLVFAYRPSQIEILTATQRCVGGFSPPDGRLAEQVVKEAKAAVASQFPGSVSYFTWRRANADQPTCELFVVPAGRLPFRVAATPVPLADFRGPIEVGVANSMSSVEFGTLMVTIEGADPAAFIGVNCKVVRETANDVDPHQYAGFQVTRAFGEPITLPVGQYRLRAPQMGILDIAATNIGIVSVARGDITNVKIQLDRPLYPVTLRMRTEDGEHLRDCQMSCSCPAYKLRLSEVILSPDPTIVRWLPEGVFDYRVFMAGPSNFETYLGTGSFTVVAQPSGVDIVLKRQKG